MCNLKFLQKLSNHQIPNRQSFIYVQVLQFILTKFDEATTEPGTAICSFPAQFVKAVMFKFVFTFLRKAPRSSCLIALQGCIPWN